MSLELPFCSEDPAGGTISKTGTIYQRDGEIANPVVRRRFIHDYAPPHSDGANIFGGLGAGNFTMALDPERPGDPNIHCSYNAVWGAQALMNTRTSYNVSGTGTNLFRNAEDIWACSGNGRDAGHDLKHGFYNVFDGPYSGARLETARYCTLVGARSGKELPAEAEGVVIISDGRGDAVLRSPDRFGPVRAGNRVDMTADRHFVVPLTEPSQTLGIPISPRMGWSGFIFPRQDSVGGRQLLFSRCWRNAPRSIATEPNRRTLLEYWVYSETVIIITNVIEGV